MSDSTTDHSAAFTPAAAKELKDLCTRSRGAAFRAGLLAKSAPATVGPKARQEAQDEDDLLAGAVFEWVSRRTHRDDLVTVPRELLRSWASVQTRPGMNAEIRAWADSTGPAAAPTTRAS